MYKALVYCKAGMGTSMLLKIKTEQVIGEEKLPIVVEYGNYDSINEFSGDLIITMEDLAKELVNNSLYIIGIKNILDTNEIKEKLLLFIKEKNKG